MITTNSWENKKVSNEVNYNFTRGQTRYYYPKLVKFNTGYFGVLLKKHWWSLNCHYLIVKDCSPLLAQNTISRKEDERGEITNSSTLLNYCSTDFAKARSCYNRYAKKRDKLIEPFETIIGKIKEK
jgi:hypothetical protein